ncbi:MAG TPA: tetratricopeptide repeat protein [Polyangiaceae bacterium]|nr:tetratricopeptide repeat protein [Polyangiaceae bacterium]
MSQPDPTDLLCRSRREGLTLDERRRLDESIECSFEVRVMSRILSELDRQSRVRPGDELMLARINARALDSLRSPVRAPVKRRPFSMLLIAAAVLLVAGLAGAWFGGARPQKAAVSAPEPVKSALVEKPKPQAKRLPFAPVAPVPSSAPSASSSPSPVPSASLPRVQAARIAVSPDSAAELFARANLFRRQGRAAEAAVLYQLLLDLYPSAREVGPSRLALGKHLQAQQPERALAQYRAVASAGGALRAEALWGISEVATTQGDHALAQQALAELAREFPDSPYAEVARARASHDSR